MQTAEPAPVDILSQRLCGQRWLDQSAIEASKAQLELVLSKVKSVFIQACQDDGTGTSTSGDVPESSEAKNIQDLNLSLMESQFSAVPEACGMNKFMTGSLWRFFTEEWVDDQVKDRPLRYVKHKKLSWQRFEKLWSTVWSDSRGNCDDLLYAVLLGNHPQISTLSGESFEPILKDVIAHHHELEFLRGNTQFEQKYIETVITRIFFTGSRHPPPLDEDILSGSVRGMTKREFRQLKLEQILDNLISISINEEREFFAYKHFFVIYCKYFDVDGAMQLRIDAEHLQRYENGALNPVACDRITKGYGLHHAWRIETNGIFKLKSYTFNSNSVRKSALESGVDLTYDDSQSPAQPFAQRIFGTLNFPDFMWFVLTEEDRTSLAALEYWFRILDIDEDGVISLYELEQFWELQEEILHSEGNFSIEMQDVICAALDLTKSYDEDHQNMLFFSQGATKSCDDVDPYSSSLAITMADLKRNPSASARFLDYFVNWRKLLERENTNGNRLYREIDEKQQAFFQQLHFIPSPDPSFLQSDENIDFPKSPFDLSNIPKDERSSWSRWADSEYDNYILQDEIEKQQQQLMNTRLSNFSDVNQNWLTDRLDEERIDDEALDWYCSSADALEELNRPRKSNRKVNKWSRRDASSSLSASFKIESDISPPPETDVNRVRINITSNEPSNTFSGVLSNEEYAEESEESSASSDSDEETKELSDRRLSRRQAIIKSALFGEETADDSWADMDPNEKMVNYSPNSNRAKYASSPQRSSSVESLPQTPSSPSLGTAFREFPRVSHQLSPPKTKIYVMDPSSPVPSPTKFLLQSVEESVSRDDDDQGSVESIYHDAEDSQID